MTEKKSPFTTDGINFNIMDEAEKFIRDKDKKYPWSLPEINIGGLIPQTIQKEPLDLVTLEDGKFTIYVKLPGIIASNITVSYWARKIVIIGNRRDDEVVSTKALLNFLGGNYQKEFGSEFDLEIQSVDFTDGLLTVISKIIPDKSEQFKPGFKKKSK